MTHKIASIHSSDSKSPQESSHGNVCLFSPMLASKEWKKVINNRLPFSLSCNPFRKACIINSIHETYPKIYSSAATSHLFHSPVAHQNHRSERHVHPRHSPQVRAFR